MDEHMSNMGFFDALFGGKKSKASPAIDVLKIKEDIKRELSSEIVRENDLLRQDLSHEIGKIHNMIELKKDNAVDYEESIENVRKSVNELNKKFSDLSVLGRLAIENKERLDKIKHGMASREELESLRNEVLNVVSVTENKDAIESLENIVETEPKMGLSHVLEKLPKSRRVLVNILLSAESPISYKQIATKMGLTYNTVKVYVRDVRESGFPIEEYMAQNKKLLNIPNSVKAAMIYGQTQSNQY